MLDVKSIQSCDLLMSGDGLHVKNGSHVYLYSAKCPLRVDLVFVNASPSAASTEKNGTPVAPSVQNAPLALLDLIRMDGPVVEKGLFFSEGRPRQSIELIIMVGYPGSGKSTLCKQFFVPEGYEYVNQDTLKTKQKCLKFCESYLSRGSSVVVDNTNPSAEVRGEYVALARKHGVPVRCIFVKCPRLLALP